MLLGLHASPMKQSLKEVNRFTFEGKGPVAVPVGAMVFLARRKSLVAASVEV